MEIIIIIGIIIVVFVYYKEHKDYQKIKPKLQAVHNEIVEEGKQLRKDAEEKMAKEKCKKGGKCNFVLEDKTIEHWEGWDDKITGHYRCIKCGIKKGKIIQYPT